MHSIFHLAIHVRDLDEARRFYGDTLGCTEGRSAPTWVDFDFFGHQLSLHLGEPFATTRTGRVGEHLVPMPHFGVVLALADWHALADRLTRAGTEFVIPPSRRFEGRSGRAIDDVLRRSVRQPESRSRVSRRSNRSTTADTYRRPGGQ